MSLKSFLLIACCLFLGSTLFAQILTGKVTDADSGEGLIGASVRVSQNKKVMQSISTDIDGNYSITLLPGAYLVSVTYTGYTPQNAVAISVAATKKTVQNFALKPGATLQEVAVTGYGATKKAKHRSTKMPAARAQPVTYAKSATAGAPMPTKPYNYAPLGEAKKEDRREQKEKIAADRSYDGTTPESTTEQYNQIVENPFQNVQSNGISTFSIDVDGAAYANVRRFLNDHSLPPVDAVRIEEMINYFDYQYNAPKGVHPFEVTTEMAPCPWAPEHRLLQIGLQGQQIDAGQLPASNLVFLIDVSGSMNSADKLPLLQQSLSLLTDQLRANDRVAIVVYAGAAGLVLPSTAGTDKVKIKAALDALSAGGSTAGSAGILLAYETARKNFIIGGNNRVILCSDGDFNVGQSSENELVTLIEKERKSGVYLSILGFGTGNYQDGKMQMLADKGNGNHAYIDQLSEAKKVLVKEFGGTLFTIAKDVKLQLHFNPAHVAGYRLIGYENRMLATEDFNNDAKDAGELGAGHRVTALYEIILAGQPLPSLTKSDSSLVVVAKPDTAVQIHAADLMVLQLRYKKPSGNAPSQLMEYRLHAAALNQPAGKESNNFKLASAVAEFGLLLRQSKYAGTASYDHALMQAQAASAIDPGGYRAELVALIAQAKTLK